MEDVQNKLVLVQAKHAGEAFADDNFVEASLIRQMPKTCQLAHNLNSKHASFTAQESDLPSLRIKLQDFDSDIRAETKATLPPVQVCSTFAIDL